MPPIIVAKKPSTQMAAEAVSTTTQSSLSASSSQSKPSIKSSINSFFSLSSMTKPITLQKRKTVSLTSLHSLSSLTSVSHPKKATTAKIPPLEKKAATTKIPPLEKKHDEEKKPAKSPKPDTLSSREVEDPLKRVQEFVSKKENEMLKSQFAEESTASVILSRFKTYFFLSIC